jgi:hypothetical protein
MTADVESCSSPSCATPTKSFRRTRRYCTSRGRVANMRLTRAISALRASLVTTIVVVTLVGPAQCQSITGGDFKVTDSLGVLVGRVVGTSHDGITIAAVPFRGKWLPVSVLRDAVLSGSLYFTSSDCTGQPYADASNSPFPASAVDGPHSTLYFEDGAPQHISVQSAINGGYPCGQNGCMNSPCVPTNFNADAVPMSPALDLNQLTPPFRVFAGK